VSRAASTLLIASLLGAALAAPALAGPMAAPAFSIKGLDGRTIRLADLRDRPLVLDFWATWCGPCRMSMPHLDAMQTRYARQGLTVLGVSVDEAGPAPVRRYAQKSGLKFTLAMANDEMLESYGPIRSIPTTFFINRKGQVVRRVVGYVDGETMESYVQEILE